MHRHHADGRFLVKPRGRTTFRSSIKNMNMVNTFDEVAMTLRQACDNNVDLVTTLRRYDNVGLAAH